MSFKRFPLILVFVSCTALAVVLYARVSHTPVPFRMFSDQVVIYAKPGVSLSRLEEIATAVRGEALRPANLPGTTAWLLDMPWATSESDTLSVVRTLLSFPEINRAEVDERFLRKTNSFLKLA